MPLSPVRRLLDFDAQYRRDQQHTPDFLHRRDRRLALARQQDGAPPPDAAAWLSAVDAPGAGDALRSWRRGRAALTVAGAVLGVLTMLGVLYVDGQGRINVTLIMALALLQLVLALATSAQALSGRRPWGRLLGRGDGADTPVLRQLHPQLAARAAHGAGLAFAVTALLTLLAQVLVRDLAFGWSTTLQTSAPAYHALVEQLAWPWRGWLPAAVPGLELVEQSRYFRLVSEAPADPERLGAWWPFLAMLWLCYVLLPRLALLGLARLHLNHRARALLQRHPGWVALRERFATPWVDSGQAPAAAGPGPAVPAATELAPAPERGVVIRWAGAGSADLAGRLLEQAPAQVLEAGGSASLEQDRDTLARADLGLPVVLLARGWEPPTGELADFLDDARHCLPADTDILLLPLANDDKTAVVDGALLAQWQRFVGRHKPVRLCRP
ncbi:MAG: DUF2868 domain-containing protein [Alcanivorax sp.]